MEPMTNKPTEGYSDYKPPTLEKVELNEVNQNMVTSNDTQEAPPCNNYVATHIDVVDMNQKNTNEKGLNYPPQNPQNAAIFTIPEQLFRRFLLFSYIILLIQYGLITLIVWLESRLRINDKFSMYLWINLGIIFGISLAGIIMAIFVIHRFREIDFSRSRFYTFFIFNIIFICIYCIALSNYVDYKYILWVLYSIDINYAFLVIYLIFLSFRFKVMVPVLLLLNFIIIIVSYYKLLDTAVSNIIKCSIVLYAFVIYNIFAVYFLRAFKIRRDTQEKVTYWSSKFWAMKISYGIYYPISFIFIIIFQSCLMCKRYCCDNRSHGTGYIGGGQPYVYNPTYNNMELYGCEITCHNFDRGDCQNCGQCKDCGDCFGCGACLDCGECDCGTCDCGDCGKCDCGTCDCGDCGKCDCGTCDCGNCDCGDCGNCDCGNCDCSGMDCSGMDCSGMDCSGMNC